MKHIISKIAPLAMAIAILSGCATNQGSDRTMAKSVGNVLGAVAGGFIGAQFGGGNGKIVMAAIGTLAGGYAGGELASALSDNDRAEAIQAREKALNTKSTEPVIWNNPYSGNSGAITATQVAAREAGCKNLEHSAVVKGRLIKETSTYCLQSGRWQLQ